MQTTLYCDAELPSGRGGERCKATLNVLPGRWEKVRRLEKSDRVPVEHGVAFCPNRRCQAKWEIAPRHAEAA